MNRTIRLLAMAAACGALVASPGFAADAARFQVHEFSLWIVENAGTMANARAAYPSPLPATIQSGRTGQQNPPNAGGTGQLIANNGFVVAGGSAAVATPSPAPAVLPGRRTAPFGLITFHGEPVTNLDVDLRIKSGAFLAHWPTAEGLPNRLRWSGGPQVDLIPKLDDPTQLTMVNDEHWMTKARQLPTLYVVRGARTERFLTYDAELNVAAPIKLAGGPDKYTVSNTSTAAVYDVLISRNTPQGRRVAWLDTLPPSGPAKKSAPPAATDAPPAAKPKLDLFGDGKASKPGAQAADAPADAPADKPAEAAKPAAKPLDPNAVTRNLVRQGFLSKEAAEKIMARAKEKADKGQDAAQPVKEPPAPELAGVEVTLSDPLPTGSVAETTKALSDRLVRAGLSPQESELLADHYAPVLFEGEALVVACRLDTATIDEKLPLSIFPDPAKVVRVPWVVMRNADPQLAGEVDRLVAELGDAKFKTREAAQRRLSELGPLAFAALNKALNHTDIEVVVRAERILLGQNQQAVGRVGAQGANQPGEPAAKPAPPRVRVPPVPVKAEAPPAAAPPAAPAK